MRLSFENLGFRKGLLIAFVVGFAVRLIPEILSYPYPIGWDTIYYAARINDGVVWNHWSNIFSTWLIYGILVSLGSLTRLEPFMDCPQQQIWASTEITVDTETITTLASKHQTPYKTQGKEG